MLEIQPEPPQSADALTLIAELDAYLNALYPPDNRFGLTPAGLQDPAVVFLVARVGGAAAGCGAVSFRDPEYGEIKRMYVRPAFRRQGVAAAILESLHAEARRRGAAIVRLETGIHQPEAIRLYERAGYTRRGTYGSYGEPALSLFYERPL